MTAAPVRHPGLRGIAIVESAKAVVALIAATGIAIDRRPGHWIDALAAHLHLNPAAERPRAILEALEATATAHLRLLAAGVLAYALMRAVEAVGLWRGRAWAMMFGAVTAAVYLPFDLVELIRRPGAPTLALMLVNLAVVSYLVYRHRHRHAP